MAATVVDGIAAACDGICRFEQEMTCKDMMKTYEFSGDCCSLSTDPISGNCVVTISDGTCAFYDRCEVECYYETCNLKGACLVPYTVYTSDSSEPCPVSEFDVSNLQYDEECPHCTCCPEEDSQNCLAITPTHGDAMFPHPDTPEGTPEDEIEYVWSYIWNYKFVRTHSPGLGDLGSIDDPEVILKNPYTVDVEVATVYYDDHTTESNVLFCSVKVGSESCNSCTPCDDGMITADCTNTIFGGRKTGCENPWAFYPLEHPARCSSSTTTVTPPPTPTTTDFLLSLTVQPHLTLFFDEERPTSGVVDPPGADEILILIEQIEQYMLDTLLEEYNMVRSIHLEDIDSSFTQKNENEESASSFEIDFSATVTLDMSSTSENAPRSRSIAVLLTKNRNFNKFVNQYARFSNEGDPNGSFYYVNLVRARVTGRNGRVLVLESSS